MTQDNQHNEMPKDTIEALLRDPLGLSTVAADSGKGHDYMCGASDQFQKDEKITKALIRTAYNKGVEAGEVETFKEIAGVVSSKQNQFTSTYERGYQKAVENILESIRHYQSSLNK